MGILKVIARGYEEIGIDSLSQLSLSSGLEFGGSQNLNNEERSPRVQAAQISRN